MEISPRMPFIGCLRYWAAVCLLLPPQRNSLFMKGFNTGSTKIRLTWEERCWMALPCLLGIVLPLLFRGGAIQQSGWTLDLWAPVILGFVVVFIGALALKWNNGGFRSSIVEELLVYNTTSLLFVLLYTVLDDVMSLFVLVTGLIIIQTGGVIVSMIEGRNILPSAY